MGLRFNGQNSRDFGLIITAYPPINHGAKRGEAYTIAGRNGTFYREDGTFDNYIQPYEVAVIEKNRRADLRASDIATWLMGANGFCRLEDTFEPEIFRMARFAGPLNIEQILGKYGRCTIEFDCLPERWLRSGEEPISTIFLGNIYNPTPNYARPLIKMSGGTDTLSLTLNGTKVIEVTGQGSNNPVIIDCDAATITDASGENIMGAATFYLPYNEFPKLAPGANTIFFGSNVTAYEITPRWWVL